MRFFHNSTTETVYALEDIQVRRAKPAPGQQDETGVGSWDVAVHIKITRADNWFDPAAWEWRHPVHQHIHERYPGDQSEQAVRADFTSNKIPLHDVGKEIPEEEYTALQQQYELRATGGMVGGLPDK